jgi:cell division protein ZapE
VLELTPLEHYQAWVSTGRLEANPQQESVLEYLTLVRAQLLRRRRWYISTSRPVQGLYLWGGVGIGKTMIMDYFYESLTMKKLRLHFHAFMQQIHQELHLSQGMANPLTIIGKRLAREYPVICFDEFLVTNVADAMILAELLKAMFAGGICLLATANLAPDQLYINGLQRERFLPAIDLLQRHTRVWHLALEHDYRRKNEGEISSYFFPLGEAAEQSLWRALRYFSAGEAFDQQPLLICGREIAVKQRTQKVVWFDFNVICGRPRSQNDYLAISKIYPVVLVSNVPGLENVSKDLVMSFIHLVDVLYDAGTRLMLSAAVPIGQLYTRGEFRQAFQRIESRLIEMHSIPWARKPR